MLQHTVRKESQSRTRHTAFSLVELLVVVAIIVVLVGILVPALSRAMEAAQAAKCMTNLRGIGKSFVTWGVDHKNLVPNAQESSSGKYNVPQTPPTPEIRRSWMGNEIGIREDKVIAAPNWGVDANGNHNGSTYVPGVFDGYYNSGPSGNTPDPENPSTDPGYYGYFNGDFSTGEQTAAGTFNWAPELEGVIVPYLGGRDHSKKMYRCPSLETAPLGAKWGSNGLFDYASVAAFTGASFAKIPAMAQWLYPNTSEWSAGMTPMIVEEDPAQHLNNRNHDPRWGNVDAMAGTHGKGNTGNYAAADGSAHSITTKNFKTGAGLTAAYNIRAQAPSGNQSMLYDGGYGHWNGR